jgi:2-keto-4-pentenoate hydratase/2-oxohepta-3-ene-1,7-dioic acid hydratase in catechol pathway
MKLLRFGTSGREYPGALDKNGNIRDLSGVIPDISDLSLTSESIEMLRRVDLAKMPLIASNVRVGPCVGKVGKFICVGLNYADHVAEAGVDIPKEPVLFMKATSAITGPFDPTIIPPRAQKVDWEVELGVVIGNHAKNISPETALSHVAGYCLINDLSERAFQLEGTGQWVKGKSADTFGPIGPWLVTADELENVGNLQMWLSVNGETQQQSSTNQMIFNVPTLISYISQFMSLLPGDIVSTGTPPGVGMGKKPPRYLRANDRVTLGIEGLGEQDHLVIE